jgi:hypothetical protein
MDISMNAKVTCTDGPCGYSTRVLLKPTTEEVTDLVVESDESFPETEYLVPISHVLVGTPGEIRLNCSCQEMSKMPIFDKAMVVPPMSGIIGNPSMPPWPYYAPDGPDTDLAKEHIPEDETSIQRGARVRATDGRIGSVDEFLVNPANDRITDLIMQKGPIWGRRDVTIPVNQIDHYRDNTVFLKLSRKSIRALPSRPIYHGRVERGW